MSTLYYFFSLIYTSRNGKITAAIQKFLQFSNRSSSRVASNDRRQCTFSLPIENQEENERRLTEIARADYIDAFNIRRNHRTHNCPTTTNVIRGESDRESAQQRP